MANAPIPAPKAQPLYTVTVSFKDKDDEKVANVTFEEANNVIQNTVRYGFPKLVDEDNPQKGLTFFPASRVASINVEEQLIQKVTL